MEMKFEALYPYTLIHTHTFPNSNFHFWGNRLVRHSVLLLSRLQNLTLASDEGLTVC